MNLNQAAQVRIDALRPADTRIEAVTALLCSGLGVNYVDDDAIARLAGEPDDAAVLVAEGPRGELLGAATVYVLDSVAVERLVQASSHRLRVAPGERVAVAKASTVTPSARGLGIGSRLADARLDWAHHVGCESLVALSWRTGSNESLGLWLRAGLELIAELPEHWAGDHGTANPCPNCGARCRCTAALLCARLDRTVDISECALN